MIPKIIIKSVQAYIYIQNWWGGECLPQICKRYIVSFRYKIDVIRNLYFCLKYLPYEQAVRVPIKIERNVKILSLKKGQIKIDRIVGMYQIIIGNNNTDTYFPELPQTVLLCKEGGELNFRGRARIKKGSVLRVDKDSKIVFGDDFFCNKNAFIRSDCLVQFGDKCSLGFDVIINTTDGHQIRKNDDSLSTPSAPILFGNNVWICTRSIIGKGSEFADYCIVAQGSIVVHKKVTTPYTLIHGATAVESKRKYERLDF